MMWVYKLHKPTFLNKVNTELFIANADFKYIL